MKTISFEFKTEDLEAIGLIPRGFFSRYEEVELLETLRLERGWRLQLLRIRRRGPLRTASELAQESLRIRRLYGLESFELVERRPRTRDYILLVRQRNPAQIARLFTAGGGEISPIAPFRADPTHTVASFYGEDAALRRVVARLRREEMPFQILRTSGRPFWDPAGAEDLTDRQRSIVSRAWALGYYGIPRRISLTRLSRLTGQSPPALSKMLRRAEGRLVARFLASTEAPSPGPVPAGAGS
jgi:DNA binding protein with HTH domain